MTACSTQMLNQIPERGIHMMLSPLDGPSLGLRSTGNGVPGHRACFARLPPQRRAEEATREFASSSTDRFGAPPERRRRPIPQRGAEAIRANKPVTVAYTYRTDMAPSGHFVFFDIEQPARDLHVTLDYSGCGRQRQHTRSRALGASNVHRVITRRRSRRDRARRHRRLDLSPVECGIRQDAGR